MRFFLIVLFFLFSSTVFANEMVDFQLLREQPEKWDLKTIQVKGFLFQSEQDVWILSQEPNLKSCCVGNKLKQDSQIVLDGNFNKKRINQVVLIEGVFSSRQPWKLASSQLIKEARSGFTTIISLIVCVVIVGVWYTISLKKIQN